MRKTTLVVSFLVLLFFAGSVWSATVGKIQGVITSSDTGEPMVGVSVSVVGTSLGANTDVNGEYRILNVPVGTFVLRISSVGFTNVEVENVAVSADLVTYINQKMVPATTDLDKTITVRGERPLITKDQVGSISVVTQEEIQALPTRGYAAIVGLQAGVVRVQPNTAQLRGLRGGRESLNSAELNIRGGRASEVAYYVDGFSQQDPLTGNSTTSISNNAIKEVTVISGGFPVEYGNVTSGIVNVITQGGAKELFGNAEAVYNDKYGKRWFSSSLGGPVPGVEKASYFFSLERREFDDRNPSAVTKDVLPGSPDKLPSNWLASWAYTGKVDYEFSPNISLTLNGNGSRDEWMEYRHSYLFNAEHSPYYLDQNLGLNAKLTHTLSSSAFYTLSGSYFTTERFRGDGVNRENLWAYGRPNGNETFDDENLFASWDNIDSVTTTLYDTMTVDGELRTFITGGDEGRIWDDYMRRKSTAVTFKGMLTNEINSENTIKVGFEFERHTLRFYQHLFPKDVYRGSANNGFQDVNRYGYNIYGEESDSEGWQNETKNPINAAVFVEERLDYKDLIITAGLRLDVFDYNAQRLRNENLPLNPDSLADTDPTVATLEQADLEAGEVFKRISPRLGIAYPVSDVTQMRFSYGKFFQRPELQRLYVGMDFMAYKIRTGGYYTAWGNPNLEPPKTTAYEIGVSHQLSDNTVFDVNIFYRDVTDLVQVQNQPSFPTSFATYRNTDYGTIKGFDFQLKMRRTQNIALNVKYTLQFANGTGSYSNTQGNVAWVNAKGPKQTAPLDYDQRHSLVGVFDVRFARGEGPKIGDTHPFENFGMNILVTAASGLPFTPVAILNEATTGAFAPQVVDLRNSRTTPWIFNIDLKAEKTFKVSDFNLTPYLWIQNVLDRDNVTNVWEGSGQADNTGWLNTPAGQDFVNTPRTVDDSGLNSEQKYRLKENNPQNYSNPRQVMFGLRVSF